MVQQRPMLHLNVFLTPEHSCFGGMRALSMTYEHGIYRNLGNQEGHEEHIVTMVTEIKIIFVVKLYISDLIEYHFGLSYLFKVSVMYYL